MSSLNDIIIMFGWLRSEFADDQPVEYECLTRDGVARSACGPHVILRTRSKKQFLHPRP